jgi:hypothetical protein
MFNQKKETLGEWQHPAGWRRPVKSGAIALVLSMGLAVAAGGTAEAQTGNPVLLGNSGTTGNQNVAEDTTEVQYDGSGAPGVVFLVQADNAHLPTSNLFFPAALGGWTSTNPSITTGVFGYTEHPEGNGVVGVTYATALNSAGVLGRADATTGQVAGVFGIADRTPIGTGVVGVGSITGGYFRANRADGRALVADGPASVTGNLFVAHPNSLIITSPNGSCWQIRVSDTGNLGAAQVGCP